MGLGLLPRHTTDPSVDSFNYIYPKYLQLNQGITTPPPLVLDILAPHLAISTPPSSPTIVWSSGRSAARVPRWLVFHMVAPKRVRFPRSKTRLRVFVADHLSLPIRKEGWSASFLSFARPATDLVNALSFIFMKCRYTAEGPSWIFKANLYNSSKTIALLTHHPNPTIY